MIPQINIQEMFKFCITLCEGMGMAFQQLIFTTITIGDYTFMFGYVFTGGLVVALITLRLVKKLIPLA